MDKKEIFEKAPVHKAVFSMALPTILSMIVIILYNMADTFFVGQTHNSLYVSAVSLASPVFLIFTAFSSMFGAGGSSVISRALGTGEKEKAKRVSALICYASILFGIVMSAVVLLGMDFILEILGMDESTYGYTKGYLTWIGTMGRATKKVIRYFKFSSVTAVILGSVLTAVMVVLRTPLVHAFIDDPEVIVYGTKILVALQMAGPILGLMFIGTNMIQAMGKVAASFVLNLLRQGIFLIPLLFILNYFFGLDGVVYSNAIADYGAVIVSYVVCIAYVRKMK